VYLEYRVDDFAKKVGVSFTAFTARAQVCRPSSNHNLRWAQDLLSSTLVVGSG
jgi:hypothetical protein